MKSDDVRLSLYRNTEQKLVLKYKNQVFNTNLLLTDYIWHNVGLTYDTCVQSDSRSTTRKRLFRIVVDSKEAAFETNDNSKISDLEILLGRQFEVESANTNITFGYKTCNPLYGQIADFAYSQYYSTMTNI